MLLRAIDSQALSHGVRRNYISFLRTFMYHRICECLRYLHLPPLVTFSLFTFKDLDFLKGPARFGSLCVCHVVTPSQVIVCIQFPSTPLLLNTIKQLIHSELGCLRNFKLRTEQFHHCLRNSSRWGRSFAVRSGDGSGSVEAVSTATFS